MTDFTFTFPTRVHFGQGVAASALKKELNGLGCRVMLCIGSGSVKSNGLYDEVKGVMEEAGIEVVTFEGIMPNPTYTKVQEGAALARSCAVDSLLALGGGSVIDCCKLISAQAVLDEDIWEYEYMKGMMPTKSLPFGAIVTASGTGAELNAGAVITYEEKSWKGPIVGSQAAFAILDPLYTATVPVMQVFSRAYDSFSHALETYLGQSDEDNVSDDLALAVMSNIVRNIKRLSKDAGDMEARGNLMWDSAMAENGVLKFGRRTDFQVHQIEHQLAAFTDCNHGQGLAVIQPVYCRHIMKDAPVKFQRLAEEVFHCDDAVCGLESLVQLCGLPTRLGQLRSTQPITKELIRKVADTTNIIKSNPRTLDRDEICQVLEECL